MPAKPCANRSRVMPLDVGARHARRQARAADRPARRQRLLEGHRGSPRARRDRLVSPALLVQAEDGAVEGEAQRAVGRQQIRVPLGHGQVVAQHHACRGQVEDVRCTAPRAARPPRPGAPSANAAEACPRRVGRAGDVLAVRHRAPRSGSRRARPARRSPRSGSLAEHGAASTAPTVRPVMPKHQAGRDPQRRQHPPGGAAPQPAHAADRAAHRRGRRGASAGRSARAAGSRR